MLSIYTLVVMYTSPSYPDAICPQRSLALRNGHVVPLIVRFGQQRRNYFYYRFHRLSGSLTYVCNEGYHITGGSDTDQVIITVCDALGTWSGPIPTCSSKIANEPVTPGSAQSILQHLPTYWYKSKIFSWIM